ncbi:MAG: DUF971 domain-containing protein [Bacteroidota bacterium]|nr:DUF971 domain-containing protein [Bacteroidota bacterium]MDP4234133.1 DUF971 domain-containing protein [Bacteroidota bacterium]MDP4244070.1 DUF971 domain-containing protein [Bacteroidota bacterium]MDP4289224.1 DUF971 domain-containing protein [Bacteroidota bacterium]
MNAKSVRRESSGAITVIWSDGHSSSFPLAYLRQECPCAVCKGETLFGQVYRAPKLQMFTPGMNELVSLTPMGHYGVMAKWKDGHDTGIYSWDYLRMICPCAECTKLREAIQESSS